MIKHLCDMCGEEHIEEDLVALLTEEIDSCSDIIEEAVCPECCNRIREFIKTVQIEHGIKHE